MPLVPAPEMVADMCLILLFSVNCSGGTKL